MLNGMDRNWTIAAALSFAAFIALGLIQAYAPWLVHGFDAIVSQAAAPLQTYDGVRVLLAITAVGDVAGIIAIGLGAAYFLRKHSLLVARLVFVLLGSTFVTNATKALIARARPETLLWLEPFLSFSFPSGHSTAIMALFGFIAAAVYLLAKDPWKTRGIVLCALVVLVVGGSRIFLGAHYLSDVIGGYLLGFAFVSLAFAYRFRNERST